MVTSTVGVDPANETSSVSLPSDDTSSLLGTTPPTPIATTKTVTVTMTKESAGIECLDEREATPKSHRYSGSGSRGHKSYDCQIEGGTSGLAWWAIPMPPALLLWLHSIIVTFASVFAIVRMVRDYIQCPQPRDLVDLLTWKRARDIRTWFYSVDYVQCLVQCYA